MASPIMLTLLLFLPCSVTAQPASANETEFWQELTNNLATDLAPIIALFGEQVTKQFLSESTTILDTIIFAVGPLGILTAVVSCIRVAGSSFLKSFIGRAREPHGVSEVELCSSTSESVCELWSNGGICRVFGRPKILEFIHRKPSDPREYYPGVDSSGHEIPATCGIKPTREFFQNLEPEPLTTPSDPGQRPASSTQDEGSESDAATLNTAESERPKPVQHWKAVSSYQILRSPLPSILSRRYQKTSTSKAEYTAKIKPLAQPQNAPDLERGDTPSPSKNSAGDQRQSQGDVQGGNKADAPAAEFAPFPNLALNIGVPKSSKAILYAWLTAIFGVALQASLLGYARWAAFVNKSFYEDGQIPRNSVFFNFTVVGTVSLVVGMGLSANVIDRTSKEQRFVSSSDETRMFWLQPGGQRIGDQEFDGFAYDEMKTEYIASWKTDSAKSVPQLLVWFAVIFSVAGWAIQFVGLRGLHGTVSLYQLVTTLIMSVLRAVLRSHRTTPNNHLPVRHKDIEGHELDWQALRFAKEGSQWSEREEDVFWFIDSRNTPTFGGDIRQMSNRNYKIAPTANSFLIWENDNSQQMVRNIIQWTDTKESAYWSEENGETIIENAANALDDLKDERRWSFPQSASRLMRIRSRLALLTHQPPYQEWGSETREVALLLKSALQKAGDLFLAAFLFSNEWKEDQTPASIVWSTTCQLLEGRATTASSREAPICFHMIRAGDSWFIDEHQLEAVLGLWSWSFRRRVSESREKPKTNHKPFATTRETSTIVRDLFEQFGPLQAQELQSMSLPSGELSNLSVPTLMSLRPPASGCYESDENESPVIFSVAAKSPILSLMAQDIFTIFLERVRPLFEHGNESLHRWIGDLHVLENRRNSLTRDLMGILVSEGLATTDEATITVMLGFYQGVLQD